MKSLAKAKSDALPPDELEKLTTHEMLERLANAACAGRIIPESQSLEGYLSELEKRKTNR